MKDKKKLRKIAILGGGGLAAAGLAVLGMHMLYRIIAGVIGGTGWILDISICLGMLLLMAGLTLWMLSYDAKKRPAHR